MKNIKRLSLVSILLLSFIIAGCTVRTYKETKDRVDQQIVGNRGYLAGEAPAAQEEPRSKTRDTFILEVEFGAPWMSKEKEVAAKQVEPERNYIPEPEVYEEDILAEDIEIAPEVEEVAYTTYEVQKNDTLQKISKKFYDTYKKWKQIYEANSNVIKDPNNIKPGMVIRIPQE